MPATKLEQVKQAIIKNCKKPFELDATIDSLHDWLQQLPFPAYPNASNWRDVMQVFPPEENPPENQSGLQIRISLKLYTSSNAYMITFLECLDNDASDINIVTVHKNWQATELLRQKSIDTSYHKAFTDMLKAKHTLWAQTYRLLYLHEALNSCMLAIIGNELQGSAPIEKKESIKIPVLSTTEFPSKE